MENEFKSSRARVEDIMYQCVKSILDECEYVPDKVQQWLSIIFQNVLSEISDLFLETSYKFCANGVITQNCGAGLYMACSSRNETNQENYAFVFYQNDHLLCTLVLYCMGSM